MQTDLKLFALMGRPELDTLPTKMRIALRQYAENRMDVPYGRSMALLLMRWNNKHRQPRVSQDFISWLYYY